MTQAQTPYTVSSEHNHADTEFLLRGRRVEDEMRLRELEMQTNFRIESLNESLNVLKVDFLSWRDSLNEKISKVDREVDGLKTRTTVLIALIVGQMAGVPAVLSKIIGAG